MPSVQLVSLDPAHNVVNTYKSASRTRPRCMYFKVLYQCSVEDEPNKTFNESSTLSSTSGSRGAIVLYFSITFSTEGTVANMKHIIKSVMNVLTLYCAMFIRTFDVLGAF